MVRVVLVDLVSLVVQLLPFLVVPSVPYFLVDLDRLANLVVPEGLVAHRCPVGLDTPLVLEGPVGLVCHHYLEDLADGSVHQNLVDLVVVVEVVVAVVLKLLSSTSSWSSVAGSPLVGNAPDVLPSCPKGGCKTPQCCENGSQSSSSSPHKIDQQSGNECDETVTFAKQ